MNVRRLVLVNIFALLVVLAAIYYGYSYYYASTHYVKTDNAFVEGQVVPISTQFAGKLQNWNETAGATVTAGQTLGTVDTSLLTQQLGAAANAPGVGAAIHAAAQLVTPISGTVVTSNALPGQTVVPGQTIAQIVDLNNLYIVANINETELRHVDVGDSVDITLDAFPDVSLKGTVASIGLAANSTFSMIPPSNNASGTYTKVVQTIPVKITLNGYSGNNLAPGMSASVQIHRLSN